MILPRSYLYVPGDRRDRLEKSLSRGADAIIADLEDAVAPDAKDFARDHIVNWLDGLNTPAPQIWVRVNRGDRYEDDLRAVASHPNVYGVFLPKVDYPDEIASATKRVRKDSPLRWAPMIESATGLVNVNRIAREPLVHQLHIGEMDLAADIGVAPSPDELELLHARSLLVIASRAAGLLPPSAPVSAEINDRSSYRSTTTRLRAMGYVGRDCIHPVQVEIANELFSVGRDEVTWARDILKKATVNPGAFRDEDGSMVDEAVLRRARGILARVAG